MRGSGYEGQKIFTFLSFRAGEFGSGERPSLCRWSEVAEPKVRGGRDGIVDRGAAMRRSTFAGRGSSPRLERSP
jgi:hypothetical protein